METRNVTLTLKKAKEWYNSNSAELREVALQAYTEEELKTPKFTDIKSFYDACKVLGVNWADLNFNPSIEETRDDSYYEHLSAVFKLDIIRKALNGDWKPSLVQDSVYYPYVRFYPAGQKAREVVSENKEWKLGESFIADGKKYTLVGGDYYHCSCSGLAVFSCECGDVLPSLGLLSCKSREIAEHMSRYFSKEIFEATYAHHAGTYQWI